MDVDADFNLCPGGKKEEAVLRTCVTIFFNVVNSGWLIESVHSIFSKAPSFTTCWTQKLDLVSFDDWFLPSSTCFLFAN